MIHIKKKSATTAQTESQDHGDGDIEWRDTGVAYVDAEEVVIWDEVGKAQIQILRRNEKILRLTEKLNGQRSPPGNVRLEKTVDACLQVIPSCVRASTADRSARLEAGERSTSRSAITLGDKYQICHSYRMRRA